MDTWAMIDAERGSVVDWLAELPEDSWSTMSLCSDWTVKDVVGHVIATSYMTPSAFFGKMISSGFSFNSVQEKGIKERTAGKSPGELVATLRSRIGARGKPPGPVETVLGETVIHSEDIFRSLGAYREHPIEHVVAVADFYQGSNLIVHAKQRISGLRVRATDANWSHGDGPEVAGPALSLVMAMTGRKVALDELIGDGVEVLRGRP
jgi:uncharacterized protein (TIGR03083 family)